MYDGQGIFYSKLTKCFYKGIFKDNKKKLGIEIFPNGDRYEGEYLNEKFDGKGCLMNKIMGYRYEGKINLKFN